MSSTYSTNLRLELIGAGEQAGTWGSTTNNNLGTLLDQAIAGYTTVAVASANQALTASNGGADESRNATIKLTTSTGANFAIYAPPVSKQYVIYNASSYTATIYNSTALGNTTAAGTGVSIGAGLTYIVWSDGTNFNTAGGSVATNLAGGAANQVPYQTGSGATSFITAPVTAGHVLTYNGSSLAWSAAGIPAGIICLWSGAIGSVPVGWYLCDGSNGTPDLRDRFIVGAGSTYSVSQTGGSADAIVVTHTHTASSVVTDPGHTHGSKYVGAVNTTGTPGGAVAVPTSLSLIPSATTGITVATTNTSTGTSGTNANLPPYYALAYIMKA